MSDKSISKPTYELSTIQELLDNPRTQIITDLAYCAAVSLGYAGKEEIVEVVKRITFNDFYKTMEAEKRPGLWQDVYRINDRGILLYVKLQLSADGKGVVIQFKRK